MRLATYATALIALALIFLGVAAPRLLPILRGRLARRFSR